MLFIDRLSIRCHIVGLPGSVKWHAIVRRSFPSTRSHIRVLWNGIYHWQEPLADHRPISTSNLVHSIHHFKLLTAWQANLSYRARGGQKVSVAILGPLAFNLSHFHTTITVL